MIVDAATANYDTDSDQMEIDSKCSDRGEKTKDSDVDIMDTDSVKSEGSKVVEKKSAVKTDTVVVKGQLTSNLSAESKTPKISVRKDLQKTPASSMAKRKSIVKEVASKTPKIDISNPAFLKPFDFGWKRELVYRTSNENIVGKRNGDIYYYTPKGKKLRSLREISEHLIGTELTIDNFTFWKEPIGVDDPDKEIIRDAKFKLASRDGTDSPNLTKKVVTPKVTKTPKTTPKAAPKTTPKTAPKLTATVTPLDSTTGVPITPKASASVTPRVVLKGKTSLTPTTRVKITAPTPKTVTPKVVNSKEKKKKPSSDDEMELGMLPPLWEPIPKSKDKLDVCSIRCLPAMGLIPTLQCVTCLCLYHPECVGLEEANLRPIHSYKCKNCQLEKNKPLSNLSANGSKASLPPPPLTPISSLNSPTTGAVNPLAPPPKLHRITDVRPNTKANNIIVSKSTSIVGGVTTWLPPSSTIQFRPPPPPPIKYPSMQKPLPSTTTPMVDPTCSQPVQTMVDIGGKRYILVPKHNVLSVCPATTSSPQILESSSVQTTMAASDPESTLTAYSPGAPILPKPQTTSPTALMVGSPPKNLNTFQKPPGPPGVLLVPYINSQQSSSQSDIQQPQYVIVNNSPGMPSGNFLFGNIPQPRQLILPTVPTSQPPEPTSETLPAKRALETAEESPVAKRLKVDLPASTVMKNFMQNLSYMHTALLHAFQYLKVQELLRASRVCHMWHHLALHKKLWETVRMKNSQVKDWEGFAATLRRTGTRHLDLRKILVSGKEEAVKSMWAECTQALSKVDSLVKIDFCRCTSNLVEQIAAVCPQLEGIAAVNIRNNQFDFAALDNCKNLTELKLKTQNGFEIKSVEILGTFTKLKHLSLLTVTNMNEVLEVIGKLTQLESLELGEMVNLTLEAVISAFTPLHKLKKLRLEKGQGDCQTDSILKTISTLPNLHQLELINFDIKFGFEDNLALCSNIRTLLIIPTYVTQSATTNHLVIEGVSRLTKTLNHFVWGLTLELLRVTDLFIDQWEQTKQHRHSQNLPPLKKSPGDSIPILKPTVKDGKKEMAITQVDVLQLPKLHKVLTSVLPTTKIIILKVPFNATWRQTIGPNST